jgi:hypothetical protein
MPIALGLEGRAAAGMHFTHRLTGETLLAVNMHITRLGPVEPRDKELMDVAKFVTSWQQEVKQYLGYDFDPRVLIGGDANRPPHMVARCVGW